MKKKSRGTCADIIKMFVEWLTKRLFYFQIVVVILIIVFILIDCDLINPFSIKSKLVFLNDIRDDTNVFSIYINVFLIVWGIVITLTVFLLGKLDNMYFKISIKQVIWWSMKQSTAVSFVSMFFMLCPLAIICFAYKAVLTFLFISLINYLTVIYMLAFVVTFITKKKVGDSIKKQIINEATEIFQQTESIAFDYSLVKRMSMLPLNNMIIGLDYEDEEDRQDLIDSIYALISMIKGRSVYRKQALLSDLIFKLIVSAGTSSRYQCQRTEKLLQQILNKVISCLNTDEKTDNTAKLFAILGPVLKHVATTKESMIYQHMISMIPRELRTRILVLSLAYIDFLKTIADENIYQLEVFLKCDLSWIIPISNRDKHYINELPDYWFSWHEVADMNIAASLQELFDFESDYLSLNQTKKFGKSYSINLLKYEEKL